MKKKNDVVSEPSSNQAPESSSNANFSTYKPYKTPQSLGKAVRQAMRSLPHSPHKKHHNVLVLAEQVGYTVRRGQYS